MRVYPRTTGIPLGALLVIMACMVAGCITGGGGGGNDNGAGNVNENDNVTTNGNDNVATLEFAGASVCQGCHPDTHADWSETIHAGALEALNGIGQGENAECLPCHTVGYGAGGFVDAAATPEFAGVQCENCHGAAAAHAANPGDEAVRPTVDIASAVCGACHTDVHHPNYEQWQESGHAAMNEDVAADLLAGGASTTRCGICHSGDVFVQTNVWEQEVDTNGFVGMTAEELNAVTCVVCHNPHARTDNAMDPTEGRDYQLRYEETADPEPSNVIADTEDVTRFNLCGQCHHSRSEATWQKTTRGPHRSVQSNVYLGEMPTPEGEEPLVENTTSFHAGVAHQCSSCHMFRRDFESEEAPTISGHSFSIDFEACAACHGSAAGAETTFEEFETEVQGRLDAIAAALGEESTWQYSAEGGPPEGEGAGTQGGLSDEVRQARFLYSYIVSDGSSGAHNPEYVEAILAKAEELLGL